MSTTKTIRLPSDLHDLIVKYADGDRRSFNQQVVVFLESAIAASAPPKPLRIYRKRKKVNRASGKSGRASR